MKKELDLRSEPSLTEAAKRSKTPFKINYDALIIPERLIAYCANKKYLIRTYGCQANVVDSENIKGILAKAGYSETENLEEADLIILNTCAIRENAEDKVFGEIGALKRLKKANNDLIIAIGGCMMQEPTIVKKIEKIYPQVDLVFGTHNIPSLLALLDEVIFEKKRVIEVYSKEGEVFENLPIVRSSKIKASVNIQYGCDKFCTYCIVPYTRGKQRSRKKEDIIKECEELVALGYQEITLLGQNVNSYGKDLYEDYTFASLLEDVAKTNITRLRFMTSHPWDFTQEMFVVMSKYKNICPFIHLPIQSGSNDVLRKMGRRYTLESYKVLVDELRRLIPNVGLSTDIIVGFPNETEEDFAKTLEAVEYCQYDSAFTFIYSPREGTPAARIKDTTPMEVKHERFDRLLKLVNEIGLKKYGECVGKVMEVLVEGTSKKDETLLTGYTDTMKLVNFHGNPNHIGKIVKVKITKGHLFYLSGEEVND